MLRWHNLELAFSPSPWHSGYRKRPSENSRTGLFGNILAASWTASIPNWPFPVQSGSMELSTAIIQSRPMLRPYNQITSAFCEMRANKTGENACATRSRKRVSTWWHRL